MWAFFKREGREGREASFPVKKNHTATTQTFAGLIAFLLVYSLICYNKCYY